MRKFPSLAAAVVLALALGATPATAQQLNLSILNNGKAPEAPVPVKVVEDGQETVVATSDGMGNAVVGSDAGIAPGTEVCVMVVDGAVVLVPKDETDCDDDAVGVIVWGETSHVTVDTGTGAFWTGMAHGASKIRVGVGVDWFSLTNLDDTGCFGASNCDADDSGIGARLSFEYGLTESLYLGLAGTYRNFQVDQNFGGGDVSNVDVDVVGLHGYGGYSFRLSDGARGYGLGGFSWLFNSADIQSTIGSEDFVESRSEDGIRATLGAGVDFVLSDRLDLRVGANYTAGDENDADTGLDVGASLILGF